MKNRFFRFVFSSVLFFCVNVPGTPPSPTEFSGPRWLPQTKGPGFPVNYIRIANGKLFALGATHRQIGLSLDATNWTEVYSQSDSASSFNDLTFGTGLYVAVGFQGIILTSPNGSQWTQIEVGAADSKPAFFQVLFANNKFFAYSTQEIWTSSDGATWTNASVNPVDFARSMVFTNDLFVAAGTMTYSDGAPEPFTQFRTDGIISTSSDGITWTERFRQINPAIPFEIVYAGGTFVVPMGFMVASTDGTNWTIRAPAPADPAVKPPQWAAFGKGIFLSTGEEGTPLFVSTNAVDWKTVSGPRGSGANLVFFNNHFMGIFATGAVAFLDPAPAFKDPG